jgi:hypothetical protein
VHTINNLQDPALWFAAIVAAVVAGFLIGYFERRYAVFISWSRTRRQQSKIAREKVIVAWSANEQLLIIAMLRALLSTVLYLGGTILVAVFIVYLRLKHGEDAESIERLPFYVVATLITLVVITFWVGLRSGLEVSLARDCYERFRKSRGLPALK